MKKKPRFQLIRTTDDRIFWRLLGGNNVSLGSGSTGYRNAELCVSGIAWLSENLVDLRAELTHKSGASWRWLLHSAQETIAISSREYGRRIEASHSLDRFRAAVVAVTDTEDPGTIVDWRAKYDMNSQNSFANAFRDLRSRNAR